VTERLRETVLTRELRTGVSELLEDSELVGFAHL
jgi:hypothetical protein